MAWYRIGTVSVTNGSPTVTGIGTNWFSVINAGDAFRGPDDDIYEVLTVNSDTSLTLAEPYGGLTASGQNYAIFQTQSIVRSLAQGVSSLRAAYDATALSAASAPFSSADRLVLTQGGATRYATIATLRQQLVHGIAVPGGSSQAYIAAAAASLPPNGGALLLGEGQTNLNSALVFNKPVLLMGAGQQSTILNQTGASADGIVFDYSPSFATGGGVMNLTLLAPSAGNTGTGSTGTGLTVRFANGGFTAEKFDVRSFATGVRVQSSYYTKFRDFQILYAQNTGLLIDSPAGGPASAGIFVQDAKISNFGFTGDNSASVGIRVLQSAGDFIKTVDITTFHRAWLVRPTGTDVANYLFMSKVLADTSLDDGFVFDGTATSFADGITAAEMHNCWAGFQTNGSGLRVVGGVDGLQWHGGRLRENGEHGIELLGGKNILIQGAHVAKNSKAATLTHHGILVGAGVESATLALNRVGNFASGLSHQQADGIRVESGFTGSLQLIGNDCRNPGAGRQGIANQSSAFITMFGNLPAQSGYSPPQGVVHGLNSLGVVASGLTVFLCTAGARTVELDAVQVAHAPVSVYRIRIQTENAPGAGQSYTYTLRKNDASVVGAVATISGASQFETDLFINEPLAPGDRFCVRLVTSAGATATRHRGFIGLSA